MADSVAKVARVEGLAMITIRADLDRAGDALAEAAGIGMPDMGGITSAGTRSLGWMSPDELLLILPIAERAEAMTLLRQALTGEHGLVVDVSDARAVYDVTGPHADDVLSKLAPVDLASLAPGQLRRSRAAQTAAAFWRLGNGLRVIGFRSSADYLGLILTEAARPGTGLAPR